LHSTLCNTKFNVMQGRFQAERRSIIYMVV